MNEQEKQEGAVNGAAAAPAEGVKRTRAKKAEGAPAAKKPRAKKAEGEVLAAKKPRAKKDPSAALAETVCAFLASKKAEDIVIVDVREKTVLCGYFVIAGGRSTTQVKALCDNLEEKLSKEGMEPRRVEGVKEGRWGVLDYGDVIVHIFNDESRLFYHLERLWGEGDNVRRYE